MKLTAIEPLQCSSVQPERIDPGVEFEINDDEGQHLVSRGLAAPSEKSEQEGKTKVEPPLKNKAAD